MKSDHLVVNSLIDENEGFGCAGTLRYCLSRAANADIIQFSSSLCNSEYPKISLVSSINIHNSVKIDASGTVAASGMMGVSIICSSGGTHYGICIDSNTVVELNSLNIFNGNSCGYAIHSDGDLSLVNCSFDGDSKDLGGAIYCSGALHMRNCVIKHYGTGCLNFPIVFAMRGITANSCKIYDSRGDAFYSVNDFVHLEDCMLDNCGILCKEVDTKSAVLCCK